MNVDKIQAVLNNSNLLEQFGEILTPDHDK
jgi:hypothetical protein